MDQRANRVTRNGRPAAPTPATTTATTTTTRDLIPAPELEPLPAPRPREPHEIERDVESLRARVGVLVGELDRRRRELGDWRLQLRRHGLALGLAVAGVLAGGAGLVTLLVARQRRRRRPRARLGRLREALARMIAHPDRVAAEPTARSAALRTTTGAATGLVAKLLLRRLGRRAR
jgi:hypothetical protein